MKRGHRLQLSLALVLKRRSAESLLSPVVSRPSPFGSEDDDIEKAYFVQGLRDKKTHLGPGVLSTLCAYIKIALNLPPCQRKYFTEDFSLILFIYFYF